MRVMVFMKATEKSETGVPPAKDKWAAMDRFTEELVASGVMIAAAGLKSSTESKRILCEGEARTVVDGPFPLREVVAGFWIWQVADMDEAVAWATRCPSVVEGRSEIEIRPFFEVADLAEFLPPGHLSDDALVAPREGERGRLGVA